MCKLKYSNTWPLFDWYSTPNITRFPSYFRIGIPCLVICPSLYDTDNSYNVLLGFKHCMPMSILQITSFVVFPLGLKYQGILHIPIWQELVWLPWDGFGWVSLDCIVCFNHSLHKCKILIIRYQLWIISW